MKGSLVLDPCGAEQAQQEAGGTLALMPTANEVGASVHPAAHTAAQLRSVFLADRTMRRAATVLLIRAA